MRPSSGSMYWCENPAVSLRTDRAIDHLAAIRWLELRAFATLLVAVWMSLVGDCSLRDLHDSRRAAWIGADTHTGVTAATAPRRMRRRGHYDDWLLSPYDIHFLYKLSCFAEPVLTAPSRLKSCSESRSFPIRLTGSEPYSRTDLSSIGTIIWATQSHFPSAIQRCSLYEKARTNGA